MRAESSTSKVVSTGNAKPIVRPVVFDYAVPYVFLKDVIEYHKQTLGFSMRERTRDLPGCSQALMSQILAGRRKLTRVNLPLISQVCGLTPLETQYIDSQLLVAITPSEQKPTAAGKRTTAPKNHLLSKWYFAYVKDLAGLKGFKDDVVVLHHMLTGMLNSDKIQKAREFLIREGFWRKTIQGKLKLDEPLVVTTHDISNQQIKSFHKMALKIAVDGIDKFPIGTRRKASSTLITVNQKSAQKLRNLIDQFHLSIQDFIKETSDDGPSDELVQVIIHLTPVGVKYD